MFESLETNPSRLQQDRIEAILEDMSDRMVRLDERLSKIETRLDQVGCVSNKMDEHIDFVNHLYTTFRFPLEVGRRAMARIAPMFGMKPVIQDRKIDQTNGTNDDDELPPLPEGQRSTRVFL